MSSHLKGNHQVHVMRTNINSACNENNSFIVLDPDFIVTPSLPFCFLYILETSNYTQIPVITSTVNFSPVLFHAPYTHCL